MHQYIFDSFNDFSVDMCIEWNALNEMLIVDENIRSMRCLEHAEHPKSLNDDWSELIADSVRPDKYV